MCISISNKKLLVTRASLLVARTLLVAMHLLLVALWSDNGWHFLATENCRPVLPPTSVSDVDWFFDYQRDKVQVSGDPQEVADTRQWLQSS